MIIHYGCGSTPVGSAFLAVTERGLCVLRLLDPDQLPAARNLKESEPAVMSV